MTDDLPFDQDLRVDVVQIASCLNGVLAQAEERVMGLAKAAFLDIPTR